MAVSSRIIRQCRFYDPESANGYYRFPSGGDSSNIVEQLNEDENGTEIKLLEWNATAAVNLLPLFNLSIIRTWS